MSTEELTYTHEQIKLDEGTALGCSYRWPGGQYCVIHTDRGILGCGIYDCSIASKFGIVLAICRGTPTNPLCKPGDLLSASVAEVSQPAADLGIQIGMRGSVALGLLLRGKPSA